MSAIVLGGALAPRRAGAQAAPPVADARPVEVTIAAASRDAEPLAVVTQELLGRLGVRAELSRVARLDLRDVVTPRPAAPPALARVWMEVDSRGRAALYLADGAWSRVLVVNLAPPPEGTFGEVSREELAHLVQDGVAALQAGRHIGFTAAEARTQLGVAPPAAPPPLAPLIAPPRVAPAAPRRAPTATRAAPARRFVLGVGHEAQGLWDSAVAVHGPAAAFELATAVGRHVDLGLRVTAQYRVPAVVTASPIGVRLDQSAVRLLAVAEPHTGSRLHLRVGLGGGVDFIAIAPQSGLAPNATLADARWIAVPIVRVAASVGLRVATGVSIHLGAHCDLDPIHARYVVDFSDGPEPVLSPALLRPGGDLTLETALPF